MSNVFKREEARCIFSSYIEEPTAQEMCYIDILKIIAYVQKIQYNIVHFVLINTLILTLYTTEAIVIYLPGKRAKFLVLL